MDPSYFSWIFLAFVMLIPLARIIPRLIARRSTHKSYQSTSKQPQQTEAYESPQQAKAYRGPQRDSQLDTKSMLVLGALNRGFNTFASIQKDTGLEDKDLDSILGELEKKGLMAVRQKQGMLGTKVELYPTDKGFKSYYSGTDR